MIIIAPTDKYTPPLMFFIGLLIERTSFRNCLFSGFVNVDLSMVLISSNLAIKVLTWAALAASVEATVIGLFSEAALEGVGSEVDSKRAVTMDTVSFFMGIKFRL